MKLCFQMRIKSFDSEVKQLQWNCRD